MAASELDLFLHVLLEVEVVAGVGVLEPLVGHHVHREFAGFETPGDPDDEGFGEEEEGDQNDAEDHEELLEHSLVHEVLVGVFVGDEHADQSVDDGGGGGGVVVLGEPFEDDEDVHVDEG